MAVNSTVIQSRSGLIKNPQFIANRLKETELLKGPNHIRYKQQRRSYTVSNWRK